jgi:cell division protein FtsB
MPPTITIALRPDELWLRTEGKWIAKEMGFGSFRAWVVWTLKKEIEENHDVIAGCKAIRAEQEQSEAKLAEQEAEREAERAELEMSITDALS